MNDKEIDRELENSENWDYQRPAIKKTVKTSRVVVSVAFPHADFALVSTHAERLGEKTSEFIRKAAIEKATGQCGASIVHGSGGTGTLWYVEQMPTITRVASSLIQEFEKDAAVTH